MGKLEKILNGWKNYLILDPAIEKVAKQRASICADCPFMKKGLFSAVLKDYSIKEIDGYYCGGCGCPIPAKIRSEDEKCPKFKW